MNCLNLTPSTLTACWYGNSPYLSTAEYRISLPADTSAVLLRIIRNTQAPSLDDALLLTTTVTPIVTQHVTEGRGFAILRLPWDNYMSVNSLITATSALVASVGTLVAQDEAGNTVVHVRDTGRKLEDGARYHETNASGGLHTDGPQLVNPPDLLFTACVSRALYGGDCLLASAATLHHQLSQSSPDILTILHENFHFDRRGFGTSGEQTLERPIFVCSSSCLTFRYLHQYILDGHIKAKTPLSDLQREAINTLQELLERTDIVLRISMNPGEVLVVNNSRICHGRTRFQNGIGPGEIRHLIRLWANL